MKIALYARVSTTDKGQDTDLQLVPLREYCTARGFTIAGEYVDKGYSGAKDRRPELDRLMNDARKRRIDCIAVWKLDRWGRSLKHLINSLSELQGLGVGFISYTENLDMTTPAGQMMFHIIGAMSQFERSLIIERIRAGIYHSRVHKGIKVGKKPLMPVLADKIRALRKQGISMRTIAKKLQLSVGVVHKTLSNSTLEVAVN